MKDKRREKAVRRAEALVEQMTADELISSLRYDSPEIRRLGIAEYNWWNEGLHGAARSGTATVFPQAIGLAAMFDVPFMREIGEIVSTEQRAKYNASTRLGDRGIYKGLTVWSPNINIFRDPRWGRGQETYGEDPFLTSELAAAFVKGLQGEGEVLRTASCIKHFAAHSGPEKERHHFNAEVSAKDAEETYYPAFRRTIAKAGVDGVMGAYSRLNGEACCGTHLIEELLRKKWGFEGVFISDCWAIRDFHQEHHITKKPEESAALALKMGCDLNCGCTYRYLDKALSKGLIRKDDLKKAAVRVYTTRFMLGQFDENTPYDGIPLSVVESEEHKNASLRASRNSIVLLENRDGFLPLDPGRKERIAVIGPNADSRTALWGNYHGTSSRYVTVLEGIRELTGGNILYSEGCHIMKDRVERLAEADDRISEAVEVLCESDVGVVVLGLNEVYEGEMHDDGNGGIAGDKKDLFLPESQRKLLKALSKVGKPLIVVLLSGGSLNPEVADEANVKAVIQGWYPGEYGGRAIAETIFGLNNPSGKLPVTFYKSAEDLPPFESYSMDGRTYRYFEKEPLYPFGHGLSYTSFSYGEPSFRDGRVEVDVSNTGAMDGEEISFVFVHTDSPDAPPNPSLAGFARTRIEKGKTGRVVITLSDEAFTLVDRNGRRYEHKGIWTLSVGGSNPGTGQNRTLIIEVQ